MATVNGEIVGPVTVIPSLCGHRLTLSSGNPIYRPLNKTAASTDTSGDTVTFAAAHGWTSGTIVTPTVTAGGLTTGTRYFINAASATTVSFHTTVAAAIAGTSKVDLTADITSELKASGVSNTSIYFTQYIGNTTALYDGSGNWNYYENSEYSLALGTLTSDLPYDVFLDNNGGSPTLALTAWTNTTTRATALTLQDGVLVKTGDTEMRYVGTIHMNSTTTTIDDAGGLTNEVGGKRFVWNMYNRVPTRLVVKYVSTATWTYQTPAYRPANNAAGNKVEMVVGNVGDLYTAYASCNGYAASGARTTAQGIGVNTTTSSSSDWAAVSVNATETSQVPAYHSGTFPVGYNYLQWLEFGDFANVANINWQGLSDPNKSGMVVSFLL